MEPFDSGLGKGSGATSKQPKVPLAEQTIDPEKMSLKTVAKCALAKSRQKVSIEQAARVSCQPFCM